MKKGYKLVRCKNDKIFTSLLYNKLSTGGTVYQIGKTEIPQENCGDFAVFEKIDDAYAFAQWFNEEHRTIVKCFRCKYELSSLQKLIANIIKREESTMSLTSSTSSFTATSSAWNDRYTDVVRKVVTEQHQVPAGTVFANKVILTGEVKI